MGCRSAGFGRLPGLRSLSGDTAAVERPASVVPLERQIACVERELEMRRRAYPRWVAEGRRGWTEARADEEICAMAAVRATLRNLLHPGLPL